MVIKTDLSDFQKICITVKKMYYNKQRPLSFIIINSRIFTMMRL